MTRSTDREEDNMATFREAAEQLGLSMSATMRRAHTVGVVERDEKTGRVQVDVDELRRRWDEHTANARGKNWKQKALSVEIRAEQRDRLDEMVLEQDKSLSAVVRDVLDRGFSTL